VRKCHPTGVCLHIAPKTLFEFLTRPTDEYSNDKPIPAERVFEIHTRAQSVETAVHETSRRTNCCPNSIIAEKYQLVEFFKVHGPDAAHTNRLSVDSGMQIAPYFTRKLGMISS
jgi:hypothetical protein